ncbi:MAG: EVE domain-containing protein, partial [Proteobacteria bacterium]|nr:EVE domain-containing protein [Pseudomonadota bacterium]
RTFMTSWIFQGNPKIFRIDDYLRDNKEIFWNVNQHRNEILCGDVVYIWRANGDVKGSGGIVAKGIIIECEYTMPDNFRKYWIKEKKYTSEGVKIVIEDVRLNKDNYMLMRDDLKNDNVVKDMEIINFPIKVNFKLRPEHSRHIDDLWGKKK